MLGKRDTKHIIRDLKYLKFYINSVKEYMHDGIDKEILDLINDIIKYIEEHKKEVK
jgi:hypothetical protein